MRTRGSSNVMYQHRFSQRDSTLQRHHYSQYNPSAPHVSVMPISANHFKSGRSPSFFRVHADESMKAGGFNTAGEAPFEIRGFSLGNAILGVGSLILAASFSTFLKGDASGGSGIGFVYGVPIMLIGFALKYAELQPVPLVSDAEAARVFELKASENLKKMKNDVTRHRYGDEAHMDTALKALGLWVAGKAPPKLIRIKEQTQAGELMMTLYFESPGTPEEMWTDPLMKVRLEKFFGPGISAGVEPIETEDGGLITVTFRSGDVEDSDAKTAVTQVAMYISSPKLFFLPRLIIRSPGLSTTSLLDFHLLCAQVEDGSVISVNLAEKPLGAVISEADTLVKSVSAKAESLGIKPGMRIQSINGYKVTKLNWLQAYKTFEAPLVIDFWVPEDLRDPVKKATQNDA